MLEKSKSKDSKCDCAPDYETQGEKKAKKPEIEKRDKDATKSTGVQKRDKKNVKKTSHSAQTDVDERRRESRPLNFRAMFSNVFDGVGPWIPYIGGSAILLTLLGLLTNNVDMLLGMFEFQFEEKSSTPWPSSSEPASPLSALPDSASPWPSPFAPASPWKAPSAPVTPPPRDSCKSKCAFRVNKDKIKWPDT